MKATAAPSIADAVLEASAALNAEGEAATSRVLAGLGRIRAGLEALEALEALEVARPVLPGEATPPLAPSHGEAAPRLPEVSSPRPLHPMAEMLLMQQPDPAGVAIARKAWEGRA